MDSEIVKKSFKQSLKEFKENRKVGMQEALTFKKGTLVRFGIASVTLVVVSLVGLSVWLQRHSIYLNAFKLRAGLNFVGGAIDTFKINEFCAKPDFLNIIKDHFAKDGLNWELGFDGKGGFETYFDYFRNKLNNFQRFEFEKLTLEYFQKNPSEINEYFGNNANFQKFANYVEGEESAAIKAGHEAVTKHIIIMALVAALLIGIAVGLCVYLKKCQNNYKGKEDGFSKKIGESLDKDANLLISCLRPTKREIEAVKARRKPKADEKEESESLLGGGSSGSSVEPSAPSAPSGNGGVSGNKTSWRNNSPTAQAAQQRLYRSQNGGNYADVNNASTQQPNSSERTQLFATSNKKSNGDQSSFTQSTEIPTANDKSFGNDLSQQGKKTGGFLGFFSKK